MRFLRNEFKLNFFRAYFRTVYVRFVYFSDSQETNLKHLKHF